MLLICYMLYVICYIDMFNHISKVSNQNLERNIAHLNILQNRSSSEMEWSNNKFDSSKFKLTY